MNTEESSTERTAEGIVKTLVTLVLLVLLLSIGGIYIYTGWTPLCERLSIVSFMVGVFSLSMLVTSHKRSVS